MFKRIAIVNRGEAAMRLIHAVREMNAERRGAEPITTWLNSGPKIASQPCWLASFSTTSEPRFGSVPSSIRSYQNSTRTALARRDSR